MKKLKIILLTILTLVIIVLIWFYILDKRLTQLYQNQSSAILYDRNDNLIAIIPNSRGYYNQYQDKLSIEISKLLVQKEDKYFYFHPGINPISSFRAGLYNLGIGRRKASSTITQQLTKILLGNELKRNIKNKLIESVYSLALDTYHSKKEILLMYANSIYFGNNIQGINQASQSYFGASPNALEQTQITQLLATISNPSNNNPGRESNKQETIDIAKNINLDIDDNNIVDVKTIKENLDKFSFSQKNLFELSDIYKADDKSIRFTIDSFLNERVREIVTKNINDLVEKSANNAAVVVIKLPENELLSIVGSPNPYLDQNGYKINMANSPRPIGSTIKPFIYLNGFKNGLRPYTLVDDREYKYITAIGFPLYPKNFDYQYRNIISLHYALSNSLNVPSLKVLEYIGLDNFYNFLKKDLGFKPIQNLDNYQLGIALGGLEMSLLDLCKYSTIFPNKGSLKDLSITKSDSIKPEKQIAEEKYIQLVNRILNDRKTGIEQFGLKSDLNLFQDNYALKTGTSRDYKDSWVVGYTPDFLVGVWVGNADNSPTQSVSGQIGAGKIWQETMELLLNSSYNKKTKFDFNLIKSFSNSDFIEYGLPNDDYNKIKNILVDQSNDIILSPHDGDIFLMETGMKIKLEARDAMAWYLDLKLIEKSKDVIISPTKTGKYIIKAVAEDKSFEEINIFVTQQ
jgi:penicillin-binding protein 1C